MAAPYRPYLPLHRHHGRQLFDHFSLRNIRPCLGNAMELIRSGKQDIMFAGGAEELEWTTACLRCHGRTVFRIHDAPETASRPMIGSAMALSSPAVVAWSCWKTGPCAPTNARVYAELAGYGATRTVWTC